MSESKPNILLILSDQHRYDAHGFSGNKICRTPNADRLAKQGVRFTRAYTPVGLCSPARTSLFTGLWPHQHHILNNTHGGDAVCQHLSPSIPIFPEILQREGYRCDYVGVWHIGPTIDATKRGFIDTQYVDKYSHWPYIENIEEKEILTDPIGTVRRDNPRPISAITSVQKENFYCVSVASHTVELLRQYAHKNVTPFFLVSSFVGPHPPYIVPSEYAHLYQPSSIPKWNNFDDSYENKPLSHRRYLHFRNGDRLSWQEWQVCIARYFALVSLIDDQIGRILKELDRLQLADNTLIIYIADHGDMTGSHRQFNKGAFMYEEVYHIPFLARWSGIIPSDSVCTVFVSTVDLMPTILDAVRLKIPESISGKSLFPLIKGKVPLEWNDDIYAQFHGDEYSLCSLRMVRTERWKYVYYPDGLDELYDEKNDPGELNNLINSPEHRNILRQMKGRLVSWMKKVKDPLLEWNYDLT